MNAICDGALVRKWADRRACYLKRRPSRRRGILLNEKEADLKQNAGSIDRQVTRAFTMGSRNAKHESHAEMARQGTAAPQPR
jgi:hypothetical protein